MSKRSERNKKIVRALRKNPDPKQIAQDFDVHISTVYRIINRRGLDLDLIRELSKAPGQVEQRAYQVLVNAGVSAKDVAKRVCFTFVREPSRVNKNEKLSIKN